MNAFMKPAWGLNGDYLRNQYGQSQIKRVRRLMRLMDIIALYPGLT